MPIPIRAVLLNVGVFLADNGIRRSVASLPCNYQTVDASTTQLNVTIPAAGTYTFRPTATPSSILVVQTSLPLLANVTLDPLIGEPFQTGRPAIVYKTAVNKLLVIDDAVDQVVFENLGAESARLSVIQG